MICLGGRTVSGGAEEEREGKGGEERVERKEERGTASGERKGKRG